MKTCLKCKVAQPETEFWRNSGCRDGLCTRCKACLRAEHIAYYRAHPEKVAEKVVKKREQSRATPMNVKRDRQLRHKYGIGIEERQKMFEAQNGCCKICGKPEAAFKTILCVDHDHKAGRIRGLLCPKCNTKLAAIEEDGFIDKAVSYLREK